jgi:hypothetical protein
MTNLGTILNLFIPVLGVTTIVVAQIAAEGPVQPSHCTELEREISSLLKEYALKVLEQYEADLFAASTSQQAPVRPSHN